MINTLYEVLDKKGPKYIDNYLNETLIITEKIDTFRILFEKRSNKYIFYKKDNSEITVIERLLNDVYEDAINEIPLLTSELNIPENYVFGLYYTPVYKPIRIPYTKIPKYILTDVNIKNDNKVIESLSYDDVNSWATKMCMGRPPIIFEGILSNYQKEKLLLYSKREDDYLSFTEMIKDVFDMSYSKEDIIEGIVIDSNGKLSQIISAEFSILSEAYNKKLKSRDFYDIVVSDITSYFSKKGIILNESLYKESKELTYINLINQMFIDYVNHKTINIDEKYLFPPNYGYGGKLNKSLINNQKVLSLVENSTNEALYRIFISSFRKIKKPYGLLNESIINKFNEYVNLIDEYINHFESNIDESRSDNVVINKMKDSYIPSDIDNMRVISSIQRSFEPSNYLIENGQVECIVYLTTLNPFTNSQLDNIKKLKSKWSLPVIVASIKNDHKISGKNFNISDELVKSQLTFLSYDNEIENFIILNKLSLEDIFYECRPNYEPVLLITDENKKGDMALQLFFEEEIMGKRLNVKETFNIGEMPNEEKLLVLRAIEDNLIIELKKLTPRSIHNVLDQIVNEYRLWSGQIIK